MQKHKSSWAACLAIALLCITILNACSNQEINPDKTTVITTGTETSQGFITESNEDKYRSALDLCAAGRFFEASEVFSTIADYRDAAELSDRAWQSMLLAPVKIGDKWGYIDNHDNLVLQPAYDEAKPFFDGQALVQRDNSWYLIDAKGNTLREIENNWLEVGPFTCGLAPFSQLDRDGFTVYGSIDYHGNVVFGAYSHIPIYFIDNTAMIVLDYERYYLDIDGIIYSVRDTGYRVEPGFENTIVPTSALTLSMMYEGTYTASGPVLDEPVLLTDIDRPYRKAGYFYVDGTIAIPSKFLSCGEFNEGLAPVTDFSGKSGYVDRLGNYVIEPVYDSARVFSQGLAAVKIDGLYGYINTSGAIVIEPQFYDARDFQEDLAAVQVLPFPDEDDDDWDIYAGWGFIDKTGSLAIGPQFGDVGHRSGFLAGYCPVAAPISRTAWESDWSWGSEIMIYGFIDKSGNWQVQPRYSYIDGHWPGVYLADRQHKSLGGQFRGPVQYDFWTNNLEYAVSYSSSSGRSEQRYYGPDGFIDQLTPYDQGIIYERSERPVAIWEELYFGLYSGAISSGAISLASLPPDHDKFYYDLQINRDNSLGLYGFSSKDGTINVPARYQEMGHFGNCYPAIQPGWVQDPLEKAIRDGLIEASVLDQVYVAYPADKTPDLSRDVFVITMKLDDEERLLLAWINNMYQYYEEIYGADWRDYYRPPDPGLIIFDYSTYRDVVFTADGDIDQPQEWIIKLEPSSRLLRESRSRSIVSVTPFTSFYEAATGVTFDNQRSYNRQTVVQMFSEIVAEEKQLNLFSKVKIDDSIYVTRCISQFDNRLVYLYLQYDAENRAWIDLFTRTSLADNIDGIIRDRRLEPILFSEYYALADYPEYMQYGELIAFYEATLPDYYKKWLRDLFENY